MGLTVKQSPNYTAGRQGQRPDKVVIHWMVSTLASADAHFMNPANDTSAHYGVEDGNVIRWVEERDTAYQAGTWPANLTSIGIEHSAAPGRPASEATYQTSGQLVREICNRWGIPIDRAHIIAHNQIVATQCPGTMNIDKIIQIAKGEQMASRAPLDTVAIQLLYNMGEDRAPSADEIKGWLGKPMEDLARALQASAVHKAIQHDYQAYRADESTKKLDQIKVIVQS